MALALLPNGHVDPHSPSTDSQSKMYQLKRQPQVLDTPFTAQKSSLQNCNLDASDERKATHQEEKDLPGAWIVQKFGGTSVGKSAKEIAEIIR